MRQDPKIKRERLAQQKQIGARMRERRIAQHIQQQTLAAKIGVGKDLLSRMESGARSAAPYLDRIAPVLKTTVLYLLTGMNPDDRGTGDREELMRITLIFDRPKRTKAGRAKTGRAKTGRSKT